MRLPHSDSSVCLTHLNGLFSSIFINFHRVSRLKRGLRLPQGYAPPATWSKDSMAFASRLQEPSRSPSCVLGLPGALIKG